MPRLQNRFDKRCPCKPDCEMRSAECRRSCEPFILYEKTKQDEYKRKWHDLEMLNAKNGSSAAQMRMVKNKINRGRWN